MITIYHNSRCTKSREGLTILANLNKKYKLRMYLEDRLSYEELEEIISQLGISVENLIRKNESDWKNHFKGKKLTEGQLIQAMVDFPKLIERPILVVGNKAVVGRPPENFNDLLSK